MSLVLSFLISAWVTFLNLGWVATFVSSWMHAWLMAWPAAALISFLFGPAVNRLSLLLSRYLMPN
ncbi:DUF2798 domain-containing protein [Salinimonas chungwhensis]|uniref:DUF2798 domain-containing protein n=1 Tax=Salinimonas chungwhensis TaxID=265425 RepID=UPI001E534E9B|nr:DUF2798 domain-containing protein [Salinimonas chungwhensis]